MITTNNEKDFIEVLNNLGNVKLIYANMAGNSVGSVFGEIRLMSTMGGIQFGIAEIDYFNRRGSGLYSLDVEEIYIHAINIEKRSRTAQWLLVQNIEHTVTTKY